MVIFFYGTTGESIKIATLVESIPKNKRLLIDTNQQPKLLDKFYKSTSFPRPDITIANGWKGDDLTKQWQVLLWLLTVNKNFLFGKAARRVRKVKKAEPTVMVVHGDTLTTVIGAILGRLMGVTVVHVEAGLRSGTWRHPFPEEIDRRIVSKLARIHYASGDVPYDALVAESTKGDVINTKANTVADSAIWAQRQKPNDVPKLPKSFCMVSVHRNEFLIQGGQVEKFLEAIREYSKKMPVVFLDHPITAARISALGLDHLLEAPGITRVDKQNYINMMHIIKDAAVIVTDSGGLQEESYYLGVPCIVFREATERTEGLGENVVLSGINAGQLLKSLDTYKTELAIGKRSKFNPTKIIIDDLKSRNLF